MKLENKEILLGVTGGIACYKSLEIVRKLKDSGANVSVVMTDSAREFIQPLPFQTLSNRPVATSLFDPEQEEKIGHISLAETADLVLIAPATANILAKMAHGLADDLLSTILLATAAPVIVAPAMNDQMWSHPAVQENLRILSERGVKVIDPEEGFLACGRVSMGRMTAPEKIVEKLVQHFQQEERKPLAGVPVLITAGPTREVIDPVRYISNRSSGKMGYALAQVCQEMGAQVTLVSGPVSLSPPPGVKLISTESAQEMYEAVLQEGKAMKIIIKAAAVSDYRIEKPYSQKQKKQDVFQLELVKNPDILKRLGELKGTGQFLVGFAAESENIVGYAQKKLVDKNLDLIIANDITQKGAGFHGDTNIVTLISNHEILELPQLSKKETAKEILKYILKHYRWE